MSHPCADMIKSSLVWNLEDYRCPYFRTRIPNNNRAYGVLWIMDDDKNEKWWNNLIEKIRLDREYKEQWNKRLLMEENDYDAETGRKVNERYYPRTVNDSETEDDSDDESSEDDDSEDDSESESESSEGNNNDNESESSEGNNNDNESVSSDPDSDDEYAECANDPELDYLFISEWKEFNSYEPYLD
jgi:cobalamin biosynthesis protein CobT